MHGGTISRDTAGGDDRTCFLARPRGTDPTRFEGVYLHNAGGPDEFGPVLWTLMRDRYRFDAAGFSREMIDNNLSGWSNIDCLGGQVAKTWDGKTLFSRH